MTTNMLHMVKLERKYWSMRDRLIAMRAQLYWILAVVDLSPVEFGTGFVGTIVGAFLLMPFDTFGAGRGYQVMSVMASEASWGAWFCFAGLLQIFSTLLDDVVLLRRLAATMLAVAWGFVAGSLGILNPYLIGIVLYPSLALLSVWVFMRADH